MYDRWWSKHRLYEVCLLRTVLQSLSLSQKQIVKRPGDRSVKVLQKASFAAYVLLWSGIWLLFKNIEDDSDVVRYMAR